MSYYYNILYSIIINYYFGIIYKQDIYLLKSIKLF